MLGKLLKYELRSTRPFVGIMLLALVGSAGLSKLFSLFSDKIVFFGIPETIMAGVCAVTAAASVVLVYAVLVRRYWTNFFGDEGYFTLTLPIGRGKLLTAKVIAAYIRIVEAILLVILAVFLMTLPGILDALSQIGEFFAYIGEYARAIFGAPGWLLAVELVLFMIFSVGLGIMQLYGAMTLGQLFRGHRLLGSIIGYIAIDAGVKAVTNIFSLAVGFTSELNAQLQRLAQYGTPLGMQQVSLHVSLIVFILLYAAMDVGLFAMTRAILKRSVNLE